MRKGARVKGQGTRNAAVRSTVTRFLVLHTSLGLQDVRVSCSLDRRGMEQKKHMRQSLILRNEEINKAFDNSHAADIHFGQK